MGNQSTATFLGGPGSTGWGGPSHLVDCVEFISVLKDKHLVPQAPCFRRRPRTVKLHLAGSRAVFLGDVEYFAARRGVSVAATWAGMGDVILVLAGDVWKRRCQADSEPRVAALRPGEGVEKQCHGFLIRRLVSSNTTY